MDIFELEKEINSLDKIKIQRLISWLTHKDIAIAALLFSEVCKKNLLDNTSENGRSIIQDEIEEYKDDFEQYIPEVTVKIKKYINLILAGKGIEALDD